MFSANENLMLRQHKRQIVGWIEETMPEEALDFGTTAMVMQVSCKAPGCVPLETAIIIVFPDSSEELVPGLPESKNGGSYKTKILKPMSDVTKDDVLEALPPAFEGGKRTLEKLCIGARDIMLAQITQLFGEEEDNTVQDRKAMGQFLQLCLQQYIENGCVPPELGSPLTLPHQTDKEGPKIEDSLPAESNNTSEQAASSTTTSSNFAGKGNVVIRRAVSPASVAQPAAPSARSQGTFSASRPVSHQNAIDNALNPLQSKNISKLFEKEHAPGIRQPGCPCCDPDNATNIVDQMMMI